MSALNGQLFIAGRRVPCASSFHAVNATTGERLEPAYSVATATLVDEAARAAAAAFPIYAALPAVRRAEFLRTIAERLQASEAALIERAQAETALPAGRLKGEVARTCGQLRLFADLVQAGWWLDARIDRADPSRAGSPKPDVRSLLRPLGPVAVFGASRRFIASPSAAAGSSSARRRSCPFRA